MKRCEPNLFHSVSGSKKAARAFCRIGTTEKCRGAEIIDRKSSFIHFQRWLSDSIEGDRDRQFEKWPYTLWTVPVWQVGSRPVQITLKLSNLTGQFEFWRYWKSLFLQNFSIENFSAFSIETIFVFSLTFRFQILTSTIKCDLLACVPASQ